ncbi:MAG: NAD(P)/FAD-dependent oxidoreductase [Paracoccaceae bacterium]
MTAMTSAERATEISDHKTCDVLVMGGGPGGAATATFLAMSGLKTVLVERESHPRFHIGESLLPGSMPFLEKLGVLDQVRKIGVCKPGAVFISECGEVERVFHFKRALLGGPENAYQVRRDEFDELLFRNATANGVTTLEMTEAKVAKLTPNAATVHTTDQDGHTIEWQARFLIDASGRSTVTSKMLQQKRPDPRNTSAAIFGHFHNIQRKEGPDGGNIRIHLTDPGWVWQIPLRDGVTSVGLVAPGEYIRTRESGIEDLFRDHFSRHPHLAQMLDAATPVGALRSTGNFSYRATEATGASHLKVGDAYGFLDPIFSTGVHLALMSAFEAANAVQDCLARPARASRRLAAYDRKIRHRLTFVSWFVYAIHLPSFRYLMLNPRNILGVEQAVISLLAGDFRPDPRLRGRIALFKAIRYLTEKLVRVKEQAHAG